MAVSFKVPASPKKNIFEIDQFLGVDLTNTGSNIDDVRSPNAENMVRFVPGKVRKRTGYQTKVDFSEGYDINRAVNSSNNFVECSFDENGVDVFNIYDEKIDILYLACELEAVGTYYIRLYGIDETYIEDSFTGTLEEPFKGKKGFFGIDFSVRSGFRRMEIIKTSSGEDDYCRIGALRISGKTRAVTEVEWMELPWTDAPEDSGVIHVDVEGDNSVYACHVVKSGTYEGNRVVNVNRALNTSNNFSSFSCGTYSRATLYLLANQIYTNYEDGIKTRLYVEFDYVSDGEAKMYIAGTGFNTPVIHNTNGEIEHCSFSIETGSYDDNKCSIIAVTGTVNVSIKNFAVMYDKNSMYAWDKAPEDNGDKFEIEDIYNVGSKNYAIKEDFTDNVIASPSGAYVRLDIEDEESNVKGFSKVSFVLHTSSLSDIDHIDVKLSNGVGELTAGTRRFNNNVNSEKIEYYISSDNATRYVKSIFVYFYLRSGGAQCTARISDIVVNTISPRDSYDISSKYYIYHVGKNFFLKASNSNTVSKIYDDANESVSQSFQVDKKIYIIDGKNIYHFAVGDKNIEPLTDEDSYIPLVTIAKSPEGGGVSYEPLNMLQPGFYEQFVVTDDEKTDTWFHLSFNNLDNREVKVWLLDDNGNWVEKTEGVDYSVNRGMGIIFFVTAPGVSPVPGEDNVRVLAYRTIEGYQDRVKKCTIGTLFGVNGASDRLFITGNPDYPNWDFYSEQYNPTYFPDTGYSALGTAASSIVGYAKINNYLATFKDGFDKSQAVFIREGDLVANEETKTSDPAFKIINTLQGNGVIAPYAIGYLQTEPLFLTRSGVYAITAQDITGEKYSQNRSFYLNGYLTKETNLEKATATVFDDQYVLALNNKLYILDGLQPIRTDKSEPYSNRQYVGFYCTNVPAMSIWTDEQALWIGTSDGKVCRFATDIEAPESYNDNGQPIYSCWETPELDGKLFYKNKTFRYFAVRLMHAIKTSTKIYSRKLGTWTFIKEGRANSAIFFENLDFENMDFEVASYSSDLSEKVIHTKVRVKKVDKARFKVENDKLNEPFGLFDLALEYIENGNYKG